MPSTLVGEECRSGRRNAGVSGMEGRPVVDGGPKTPAPVARETRTTNNTSH